MKKFRILTFHWYKIFHSNPKNDRYAQMKKKYLWVATFFLGGCMISWKPIIIQAMIYTHQKKMLPPLNTFFSFDHISVISWVWVENLISLESRYYKLFHGAKIFLYFEDFLSYEFLNKNHVFFSHIKKCNFPICIKKIFFLWKLLITLIILQKSFWKKMWVLMTIWWSEYECDFWTSEFP